jgi:hypothetical protein
VSFLRVDEPSGRIDECEVGERLWIVAEMLPGAHVDLLGGEDHGVTGTGCDVTRRLRHCVVLALFGVVPVASIARTGPDDDVTCLVEDDPMNQDEFEGLRNIHRKPESQDRDAAVDRAAELRLISSIILRG